MLNVSHAASHGYVPDSALMNSFKTVVYGLRANLPGPNPLSAAGGAVIYVKKALKVGLTWALLFRRGRGSLGDPIWALGFHLGWT